MNDLNQAKSLLYGDKRIVLVKDNKILTSNARGISPMLNFILQGENLQGFSLADKIVGKAAALLFVKAKIKNVYAKLISKSAIDVLKKAQIFVEYETMVETIINRDKTGTCPMEQCVMNVDDCEIAFTLLLEKYNLLKNTKIGQ